MKHKAIINKVIEGGESYSTFIDFYKKCAEIDPKSRDADTFRKYVNLKPELKNIVTSYMEANKTEDAGRKSFKDSGKIVDEGNYITTDSKSNEPLTFEEIVANYKIDLDSWVKKDFNVGYWDTFSNKLGMQRHWKSTASFVRKIPIALDTEIFSRLTLNAPIKREKELKDSHNAISVVFGDAQIGYYKEDGEYQPTHDRKALDAVLTFLGKTDTPIREIVIMGDMLDFPNWSDKFLKSPDVYFTTQMAIQELYFLLMELRVLCPKSKIVFLEGNHEVRMPNLLKKYLSEAFKLRQASDYEGLDVLSVPFLMDLESLDIEWCGQYPQGTYWLDDIEVYHGNKADNTLNGTVRKEAIDSYNSKIFGHSHRLELAYKTIDVKGERRIVAFANSGCLCRIDGKVPSNQRKHNWQQGLVTVNHSENGNNVNVHLIDKGKFHYGNEIFEGNDYTENLRKFYGNNFPF